MITLRPRDTIHHTDGGWFSAYWHFSFDDYSDPDNTWFGDLRVFNDDTLVPGATWPMHPHRDIEGITYVADGVFEHADSRGNGGVLLPGSVQRATLGSGMQHSEGNRSRSEPMRFIQMWIIPAQRGLEPGVEQKVFTTEDRTDTLLKVMSGDGGDAVLVHQDANVYVSRMSARTELSHAFDDDQGAYLYVIDGSLELNDEKLGTGDAAKIEGEREIRLRASEPTELVMVKVRV